MRTLFVISLSLFCVIHSPVSSQTIINQDGKFGVSDENGVVILKPLYDSIIGDDNAPTFFIVRNGGKYTYFYKHGFDSITWMKKEDRYWVLGDFEFDSLKPQVIGASYYNRSFGYSIFKYSKAGKWGMIYLQTYTVSGDGMFPSAGFYAYEYGKLGIREARYDAILRSEPDDFFTTYLNGKYGLWNVVTGEEYISEFDTIPVFKGGDGAKGWYGLRERHVRKNGKWGVVRMDEETKTLNYIVPCRCGKVSKVAPNTYACTGSRDTITLFNTITHTEYTPLVDGKPLIFSGDSMRISIYEYNIGEENPKGPKPLILSVTNNNNPPSDKSGGYNEFYWIDPVKQKVTAYNDSGFYYNLYLGTTRLISQVKLHSSTPELDYNFYDLETKQFLFKFSLDSSYTLTYGFYHPNKCSTQDDSIAEFYYYDKKDRKKVVGYYNSTNKRFTRRKPKCN